MRARCWLALPLLLVGCATRAPILPELLPKTALERPIELTDTPFFPQSNFQCGPAALATALVQSGVEVAPDALVDDVYLPARKGSLQAEMVAAGRRHGRIPFQIPSSFEALVTELQAGRPVLVLQNLGLHDLPVWHYAVVVGIEPHSEKVILRSGKVRRKLMHVARFVNSWRRSRSWGIVLLRPGELPAHASADAYVNAVSQSEKALKADDLRKAYRAALARWPENLSVRFGLAHSLELSGRPTDAAYQYRAILKHRPDHPVVLNNFALTQAKRGCYAIAEEAIARALGKLPAEHEFRETIEDSRQLVTNAAKSNSPAFACTPLIDDLDYPQNSAIFK